jgi:hypothetical protein
MKEFILIAVLTGQAPTFLGNYESLAACTAAIRQVIAAKIYVGAVNSPAVQAMIDTTMQFQQEYQCIPKK